MTTTVCTMYVVLCEIEEGNATRSWSRSWLPIASACHTAHKGLTLLKRFTNLSPWGQCKVSLLGVDSLWGDCMFIPADSH